MATVMVELVIRAAEPNRPPVVLPTLPQRIDLAVGGTVDLSPHFSDPDGDTLTFSLQAASVPGLVEISAAGVLKALKVGEGTAQIVADDGRQP